MSYVCRDIRIGSRDINHVVKDFKCKPFISPYSGEPAKMYKPYWSEELEKFHGELSDARDQQAKPNPIR